ncbi:MAG: molybdenum ABC transporter ATP-binding protein [Gammaproteobacteria bacterium]|nr:molybdenum ABC transporter ATP-binding protein [Gammaproteobacteria bacterium]
MSLDIRLALQRPGFSLNAELVLPGRGVTALFGPSGSGKTSLLRAVAGLERASGQVTINGQCWQDDERQLWRPVDQRPLGYVFQEASLFAHLSVRANLEFGYRRLAPSARQLHPEAVISWLDLAPLLDRPTAVLSGGERQRVAIGRALLASPQLLLMDEPLAALDKNRRGEILPYLERLHTSLEMPVLYVSHDSEEVVRLADQLVLLEQGQVVASGQTQQLLADPILAAHFGDDAGVLWLGQIQCHDDHYHLTRLQVAGGSLWVSRRPESSGDRLRLQIRARDVSVALNRAEDSSISNLLPATLVSMSDSLDAGHLQLLLDAGGEPLLARISRRSAALLGLKPGLALWAQIKAVALLA